MSNAFEFQGSLRFTDHRETEGEAYYRKACRNGWEGVIAKNGDSVYVLRRTRDWLKFKCIKEQEFVIGGYTEPRGSRNRFWGIAAGLLPRRKARLCRQGRDRLRSRDVAAPAQEARRANDAAQPVRRPKPAAELACIG